MSWKYSKIPDKHEVFVTIMKIFDFWLFRVVVIFKNKDKYCMFLQFCFTYQGIQYMPHTWMF